jgi:hypothetical protein
VSSAAICPPSGKIAAINTRSANANANANADAGARFGPVLSEVLGRERVLGRDLPA